MICCCTAFKGNTVNAPGKVDKHHIAHFGLAGFFHFLGWPVFFGQTVHCLVNLIFIGWQGWPFNSDSRQIRNGDFRHYFQHQLGNQILAIFIGYDIQTWLAGKFQRVLFYRVAGPIIQLGADNLALYLITKTRLDHSHRHFARAKARHIGCFCHFTKAGCDFAVQVFRA